MKRLLKMLARTILSFGVDPRNFLRAVGAWPQFFLDFQSYRQKHRSSSSTSNFPILVTNLYPHLLDKSDTAGSMGEYFYQDLFVAQKIFQTKPPKHVDIGSRVDGFVAHLLTFMSVQIVDVRPLRGIDGLIPIQADARDLRGRIEDGSVPSLSCLHALEHFGLGRYGDKVDPDAWITAFKEMARILQTGGQFYLSVPVGEERVEFNAHRIFSPQTILNLAGNLGLSLESATHINSRGVLITSISEQALTENKPRSTSDSLVIFEFTK